MVAAASDPSRFLGVGLYTPAEAAFYARVPASTLMRWLWGTASGQSVFQAQFDPEEKLVSFLDLVTALAIRAIRQERKIPLQRIREAIDFAENKYGISHPLARDHVTFLKQPGDQIVINITSKENPDYVEATGRHKGNRLLRPIAEFYLTQLSFDAEGLAARWTPDEYRGHSIVLNPKFHFGEPIVESCGYTAETLWDAYRIEGGVERAALAYGVEEDEVRAACKYIDNLLAAA